MIDDVTTVQPGDGTTIRHLRQPAPRYPCTLHFERTFDCSVGEEWCYGDITIPLIMPLDNGEGPLRSLGPISGLARCQGLFMRPNKSGLT